MKCRLGLKPLFRSQTLYGRFQPPACDHLRLPCWKRSRDTAATKRVSNMVVRSNLREFQSCSFHTKNILSTFIDHLLLLAARGRFEGISIHYTRKILTSQGRFADVMPYSIGLRCLLGTWPARPTRRWNKHVGRRRHADSPQQKLEQFTIAVWTPFRSSSPHQAYYLQLLQSFDQ